MCQSYSEQVVISSRLWASPFESPAPLVSFSSYFSPCWIRNGEVGIIIITGYIATKCSGLMCLRANGITRQQPCVMEQAHNETVKLEGLSYTSCNIHWWTRSGNKDGSCHTHDLLVRIFQLSAQLVWSEVWWYLLSLSGIFLMVFTSGFIDEIWSLVCLTCLTFRVCLICGVLCWSGALNCFC